MKAFLFLTLTLFTLNIYSQGIVSVQKIGDKPITNTENMFVYSLPRTVLAIKVVTRQTTTFSGPYFSYADEYLGLKGVPSENKTEWDIDSIDIFTYKEADPNAYYAVRTKKDMNPASIMQLTESGIILDPSKEKEICQPFHKNSYTENSNLSDEFSAVSMEKYYNEKTDTLYKTILKDSVYLKIPLIRSKEELKTLKDKAREAADVIIKIRQRKFEMVLSEDEVLPEANSFKTALNEMQKTEDEYLALFTGRRASKTFTNWFFYTPEQIEREPQFELFRFSEKSGISDRTTASASPVFISFRKMNRTKVLGDGIQIPKVGEVKSLVYRIPDAAIADVSWNDDLLASKKLLIYQFGALVPFPADIKK
jgi:hypothetical protein